MFPQREEYLEVVEQEHFKEEITVSSEKPTDIDGVIAEVRVPDDVPEYKVATEEEQPTVLEKEHFKEEITISSETPTDVDKLFLRLEVPKEDSQLEEEQVKETEETFTFETEEEIPESVTEVVVRGEIP